ncbi:MAG TPA: type II toxin-antitoxin system RelB/DinJ family antitoxin [Caldilineae bacterium]|nr:type II toxin-antitoxin system RelB/DinJ family antitoxin [Caldilineae bacterium]
MPKTAVVTARIEPDLKKAVESTLSRLGLTTSQAISLYFRQIEFQGGIPFPVKIPNQETRRAIAESMNPQSLPGFDDIDDLFNDLDV